MRDERLDIPASENNEYCTLTIARIKDLQDRVSELESKFSADVPQNESSGQIEGKHWAECALDEISVTLVNDPSTEYRVFESVREIIAKHRPKVSE